MRVKLSDMGLDSDILNMIFKAQTKKKRNKKKSAKNISDKLSAFK